MKRIDAAEDGSLLVETDEGSLMYSFDNGATWSAAATQHESLEVTHETD